VTTANDPWGRVDADGTVYVRAADGERVIGSWAAGSPEEALAFFRRKFESLQTEVALIEQRMKTTEVAPAQAQATVERLLAAVADANAIGDLEGLKTRLEALTGVVGQRREEAKAAREQARGEARGVKERIVAEAERIAAEATQWKASGERMAELLQEWKAAPHADRAIEATLWKRLSAARNSFTKRRKAYFASLESERDAVRSTKDKLVEQAEALADSTDWAGTSSAYRELMRQWKEAGRAGRDDEAELWKRFRGAQDKFFAARSEVFTAKETELRTHAGVKEQLLAEAQALLPVTDWRQAKSALRSIQERWEQTGPVPRESREQLEQGLRRVEDAVKRAEEAQWKRSNPEALARAEATVNQLRTAINSLESQLAKAQARGDAKAIRNAEEAITARKSWLVEAEHTLAELSG
jgi:chromosome segregation ATPase